MKSMFIISKKKIKLSELEQYIKETLFLKDRILNDNFLSIANRYKLVYNKYQFCWGWILCLTKQN